MDTLDNNVLGCFLLGVGVGVGISMMVAPQTGGAPVSSR